MALFVLMAARSEGASAMMLSRLPVDTQARRTVNERLRRDRIHITGWYRPFPRCARAPSSRMRVFSHPSQVEFQGRNASSSQGPAL